MITRPWLDVPGPVRPGEEIDEGQLRVYLSTVLPQHRVPSLYQLPAALRGARLAVRHAVAKPPRRADLDVAVAQRHGQPPGVPAQRDLAREVHRRQRRYRGPRECIECIE